VYDYGYPQQPQHHLGGNDNPHYQQQQQPQRERKHRQHAAAKQPGGRRNNNNSSKPPPKASAAVAAGFGGGSSLHQQLDLALKRLAVAERERKILESVFVILLYYCSSFLFSLFVCVWCFSLSYPPIAACLPASLT
jgi:hypothetical protein